MINKLLFIFLILMSGRIWASDTTIYYGGFSYLGDNKLISANFPFSSTLNEVENGQSVFDIELIKRFQNNKLTGLNIIFDRLASIKDEQALSLTLAIESESISVEEISDKFKVLIQISAQIILFDQKNMLMTATYPIDLQLIDVVSTAPKGEGIKQYFNKIYFESSKVNLFDRFIEKLTTVKPSKKYSNHLRVLDFKIEDKLIPQLENWTNIERLSQNLGITFTRFLSENQSVSVLPFVKGHAIGNKLAGRYANGEAFMLTIPEPDYAIELTLTGMKKLPYKESKAGRSYNYAIESKFKFYEPLTNTVFYEGKMVNGAIKKVPVSQVNVDDWASFNESIKSLFDKVTSQLYAPQKGWYKKHARGMHGFNQFKSLKEVIEKCR